MKKPAPKPKTTGAPIAPAKTLAKSKTAAKAKTAAKSKTAAKAASPKVKRAAAEGGAVYVAWMRGINVGGKNIVPMKDLAAIFVAAGCDDVRTYIQSGNVVFRASPKAVAQVASAVAAAVKKRFGFHVPVVVRTLADLRAVVALRPLRPLITASSPTATST